MEIPVDMDNESALGLRVPSSQSIDDFALAQGGDFRWSETEPGEYLLGLLTETGRMMLEFGERARETGGRSHRAHSASLGMFIFKESLVRDELRIAPDRVEVVDRAARHVSRLDPFEPIGRRLRGNNSISLRAAFLTRSMRGSSR
jgi:hypothetical protein